MSYELYNPHVHNIDCSLPRPIGMVRVEPNECLPTPEQEAAHLTAEVLKEFVIPNLLHPTPAALRRRLLLAEKLEVPEDLVALTKHLPEFGGPDPSDPEASPVVAAQAPKQEIRHVFPENTNSEPKHAPSLEEQMQVISDQRSSSSRPKNVENP